MLLALALLAAPACRTPNLGDDFGKLNRAAMDKQAAKEGPEAGTLTGEDAKNVMRAHQSQTPAGQTSPGQNQGGEQGQGMPIVLTPK
jgi:hypothetical protein